MSGHCMSAEDAVKKTLGVPHSEDRICTVKLRCWLDQKGRVPGMSAADRETRCARPTASPSSIITRICSTVIRSPGCDVVYHLAFCFALWRMIVFKTQYQNR